MLEDFNWLQRQLKTMGSGFDKEITGAVLSETIAFGKGVLWREKQLHDRLKPLLQMFRDPGGLNAQKINQIVKDFYQFEKELEQSISVSVQKL